ncbi:hypothetical protein JZU71_02495 [bacterium]|nr:hypothetical protein [bacterium]
MRYNDLANLLADQVSPRELLKLSETDDVSALCDATGLPKDRASRLLSSLRDAGMGDVVTCSIEDNVRMCLLDGVDYKPVEALSAGQRCTVILSIVLQYKDRILVIDQPEDHLDNAFIASTVIQAIKDLVIELVSDGRHGFVEVCKPLDHPKAVAAISSVMEGGPEAFKRRAKFYSKHNS